MPVPVWTCAASNPEGATCRIHCFQSSRPSDHHRPLPQAVDTIAPPPSTSTLPPSERAVTVDLDPTSRGAHHSRPLPQALDTTSGEGATPPLPHYRCRVNVCRNMNEI
jgi:hypothetical protein